ncbi:MAG: elongation factor 4, partial [Candidatus Cloacimonadota bacterium]
VKKDLADLLGVSEQKILEISAKEDIGINLLLDAIIQYVPPPKYEDIDYTTALIFDSKYDKYRGVIVYVRVFCGELRIGMHIKLFASGKEYVIEELGYLELDREKSERLTAGEVGYIFAGIKDVRDAKVGDTITSLENPALHPLAGFRHPKPMVFSGIYPLNGEDYEDLKDALAKLQLNDASLTYEKENSLALGYGFRCGFLGLLHLEIFKERLDREYNIPIISTMPSVEFIVIRKNGEQITIDNPFQMPSEDEIADIKEPIMECEIITPPEYIGNIVQLARQKRGIQKEIEYLDKNRMLIYYEFPLIEIIFDFYDKLKSVTRGYASFDYHYKEYRSAPLVRVDILVNKEKVDAMSFITHRDKAYEWGKNITEKLSEVIPKHLFTIPIQASSCSRIIARSTIKALRKNVTAKCYGGDITRKKKLLERQKKGKKRMREIGKVRIPQDAFLAVLKAERA